MKICGVTDCGRKFYGRGLCGMHYQRAKKRGELPVPTVEERFLAKVTKTDTCWLWTARINKRGYGMFRLDGRTQSAHRVSYVLANGAIPSGLEVDHECHNRSCVRPQHLKLKTRKENMENLSGPYANNKSGIRGVHLRQNGRWGASIRHNQKQLHVGVYATAEEAEAAVIARRNELFTNNTLDRAA